MAPANVTASYITIFTVTLYPYLYVGPVQLQFKWPTFLGVILSFKAQRCCWLHSGSVGWILASFFSFVSGFLSSFLFFLSSFCGIGQYCVVTVYDLRNKFSYYQVEVYMTLLTALCDWKQTYLWLKHVILASTFSGIGSFLYFVITNEKVGFFCSAFVLTVHDSCVTVPNIMYVFITISAWFAVWQQLHFYWVSLRIVNYRNPVWHDHYWQYQVHSYDILLMKIIVSIIYMMPVPAVSATQLISLIFTRLNYWGAGVREPSYVNLHFHYRPSFFSTSFISLLALLLQKKVTLIVI